MWVWSQLLPVLKPLIFVNAFGWVPKQNLGLDIACVSSLLSRKEISATTRYQKKMHIQGFKRKFCRGFSFGVGFNIFGNKFQVVGGKSAKGETICVETAA
jgi:hypothetical protein